MASMQRSLEPVHGRTLTETKPLKETDLEFLQRMANDTNSRRREKYINELSA